MCSQLAKGQVNMTDEAKLRSPIHSTLEALVVQMCGQALLQRRIGPFLLTSASCRDAAFGASHRFAEHNFSDVMVSLGFRKL